jgi:hypothetical protein
MSKVVRLTEATRRDLIAATRRNLTNGDLAAAKADEYRKAADLTRNDRRRRKVSSLQEAIDEIHRQFGEALSNDRKAESCRLYAGKLLLALRQRIEAGEAGEGVNWWQWYESKFVRSRKDAEKVMRLASAEDFEAAEAKEKAAQKIRNDRKPRIGAVTAPTRAEPTRTLGLSGDAPIADQVNAFHREIMNFYTTIEPKIRSLLKAHPDDLEPAARVSLMQATNIAGEGFLALAADIQRLAAAPPDDLDIPDYLRRSPTPVTH